jgi:hypothetical protein
MKEKNKVSSLLPPLRSFCGGGKFEITLKVGLVLPHAGQQATTEKCDTDGKEC